jgi:thymidylate synthase
VEISNVTGSAAYLSLLAYLISDGERAAPRGLPVLEARNVTLTVYEPEEAHVLRTTRRPAVKIAATEALHLLAGTSSLEQLDLASNGAFTQFADRGRLRGAYGPRAGKQLSEVPRILSDDPDSRQAVVSIWSGDEVRQPSRDVPCTLSYQFFIRGFTPGEKCLELRTVMRSNDAWLGLPYDFEVARALHLTMAACLGIEAGPYTHTVGSMHLYESNIEQAKAILGEGPVTQMRAAAPPASAGLPDDVKPQVAWGIASVAALDLVLSNSAMLGDGDDWRSWYAKHVPRLPEGASYCSSCRYTVPGFCYDCFPTYSKNVSVRGELL